MDVLADALLFAGVAVVVVSSLCAIWLRGVFVRLHYLSPVTSLGGPLVGLALAIHAGWTLTTAIILLTVAVLAFSGPAMTIAIARSMTQREAIIEPESPE